MRKEASETSGNARLEVSSRLDARKEAGGSTHVVSFNGRVACWLRREMPLESP